MRGGNGINRMNSSFLKRDVTAVLNIKASNVTANYSNNIETSEDDLIELLVNENLIHQPVLVNASMKSASPPFAEVSSTGKKFIQQSHHQMRQKALASVVDPLPLNINCYNINNGFSSKIN
ncbi:uncharacterized protein MONOS_15793 [Monocercomonoides exilis]|uniref:uncharacterized protein n=1 Tax=Monocercomonoides exilis TaxID=2049356 RepID=UPI00355A3241|nr:hypothetical protein MONOS_15793 [Monocercomonoides exilis]|eukprot:MONOS_15793.1-p1 / transcript=MONOS_15793.1 / gene=MONOS_15793 / organism=Monocercomonoides_exilis_PA203 / gene_product=unspecified product / transcript_product=unspecified product / location=Mono_scaffold01358:7877-8239(-) / protein_length=121 / sequence_SO=supercontig / SO=protein_coding / is_pseudo=false